MAWVERLVPRTTQPQDACGIDWSNPITRGLRGAVLPALGVEVIDGGLVERNGAPIVVSSGKIGSGAKYTVENIYTPWEWAGDWTRPPGEMTLVSISQLIQTPAGSRRSVGNFSGGVVASYGQLPSATNFRFSYIGGGSQVTVVGAGVDTLPHVHVGRVTSATTTSFIDGRLTASASSPTLQSAATNKLRILGDSGSGLSSPEIIYGVFVFWRALSDAEVKSLSDNPWQIFEPEVQRVWVDDFVSAGGGVTGTLNATESGPDTGSLSGQVVTQGTLSAAELTGDTVAMAGGVIVQGALSATEAGSDTASISGASVATGTLNASEAGSDTASLAGVVIVQGAASASETGSDTLASTGLVLVKGALSVSETGSDTAVINGSSVITTTGDINASESGADSAAMTGAVLVQALINAVETGGDTAQLAGQIIVTGVLGAAEVGSDTALIYSTAPVLVIAGATTRPSRMQTGERPMQLQSSERASRLQSSTRPRR